MKQCFELLRKLLLDQDIVVPVSLFSDLTAACGRVGTAQDGLNALKMLLDTRTPPDNVSPLLCKRFGTGDSCRMSQGMFNQLLNLCARENRPDLAQGVVDMMTEAGVRPTPETFSIINKAREDHDSSGTDVSGGETEEEEHTSLRPQRPIPVPPQQQDVRSRSSSSFVQMVIAVSLGFLQPVAPLPPRRGFSKPRLKYGQTTLASATFAARIASKSEELASMLKNTPSIKHEQRVKPPQRSPSASTTTARRAPIPPRKSKPASVPQKAFPPRSPPATASPSAPQPAEAVVSVTSPTADAASTFSPSGPLSTRPAVVELEQKPGGPSAGSFTREGLSNMTVVQLKEVLKTAGLKTSGLKSELIQRLVDGKKHTVPSKPRPSSTE